MNDLISQPPGFEFGGQKRIRLYSGLSDFIDLLKSILVAMPGGEKTPGVEWFPEITHKLLLDLPRPSIPFTEDMVMQFNKHLEEALGNFMDGARHAGTQKEMDAFQRLQENFSRIGNLLEQDQPLFEEVKKRLRPIQLQLGTITPSGSHMGMQ